MESLSSSRYMHRKLSGGLSAKKNPYDDVFAGQPPRVPRKILSPKEAQDYNEIFGSSRVSSIPILDLPPPDMPNSNKQQLLDYSNIFGADDNDSTTLSYQQLRLSSNNAKTTNKTSSPHSRSPSAATGFPLQDTDHLSKDDKVFPPEASYQLFDDKKRFNMSYHKTSLGSKDGENGTIHVAQFHHVPGFTCFVDETSPENTEADKLNPLPKNDIRSEVDFGKGVLDGRNANKAKNVANKQAFGREVKSRSGFSWDASYSSDRLFNAHDDLKSHPSKVRPLSGLASNLKHNDDHSKRWTAGNAEAPESDVSEHGAGDYSPPFFGEELVENSAAAASAAVLRNAIQKAQESIRIAKELMERKREGLRRSSTQNFKDKSRVVDRRENIILHEGRRSEDNNAKDTCGSADSIRQVFSGMGKKSALRSGDVVSDFKDTERIIVAGKATIVEHAKNPLAAEKSEPTWFSSLVNMRKNRTAISSIDEAVRNFKSTQPIVELECNVKETNVITETLKKQQEVIHKDQADEKALEVEYMERKPITVSAGQVSVENVDKLESGCVVHEHEEIGKGGFPRDDEENEQKQSGFYRNEDCEKKLGNKRTIEGELNFEGQKLESDFEKRLGIAQELEENEKEKEEDSHQENIEKRGKYVDNEVYELKQKRIHDEDVDEEEFEDASHWEEDENELKEAWGSEIEGKNEIDIFMGEDTKSRAEDVQALKVDGKTSKDLHVGKEREEPYEEFELEENENGVKKSYRSEEKMYIEMEADNIEVLHEAHNDENYHKASNSWSNNANENISETQDCQCGIDSSTEPNQTLNDKLRIGAIEDSKDFEMGEAEALKFLHKLKEKETSRTASLVQGDAEDGETKTKMRVAFEVFPSEDSAPKFGSFDVGFGKTEFVEWETEIGLAENLDNHIEIQADGSIKVEDISGEDVTSNDEESGNSCVGKFNREQQYTTIKEDFGTSYKYSVSKEEKIIQIDENIRTRENTEMNEEKFLKNPAMYENETNIYEEMKTSCKEGNEENPTKFPGMEETSKATAKGKEEKEYLMQIDEANKREREREKEKMAVERAIREVRERAFAEARERAERAAVERATVEVRHRVMDEARGKHEKATAVTKSLAEKASIEAKFKSERAAVERATAEARERALQKALSQTATSRAHGASFLTEKFSAPSRDNAMKKSLSSSDLQIPDESNNESSQRSKARLERDERIMERAARALAEKNKRDLLAQKEQAEKNRISDALDADIKRWSTGKEGNLRALLSTLQYILGPASGWQAIPLTDIVTPNAVKKAYRKATLYVHPDKLQQRGASIQQKYICEKVFDLLKAAWNRFNSEER